MTAGATAYTGRIGQSCATVDWLEGNVHVSQPECSMLVLLLVLDKGRRRRLADACRAASPEIECVESDDVIGAVFSAALDRLDLVVLDSALLHRHGNSWLTNWRRLAPRGDLLLLGSDPERDVDELRRGIVAASKRKT